jgi:hypothetical protein
MNRRIVLGLVVLFAAAASAGAKDKDPAAAEAKWKPEAAKALVEHAAFCAQHGAKKEGLAAAADAAALDPNAPKLAEAKSALEAMEADAPDADALAKQRKTVGPKIAGLFDKLAAIDHEAKDAGRFEDYVFRGYAWDTTPARLAKIRKSVDEAIGGGRFDEGGRLLVRVKRVDPDGVAAGRYEKTEIDLATKDVLLLGSDDHPLVGYVSLPRDWAKGKTYPVLVAVDGAGCNFLGCAKSFCGGRASRPLIVLSPITLSNTNALKPETYPCYGESVLKQWDDKRLQFDGPGIDALLGVIKRRFGGEDKVFVTGFSGGGQWAYWKLFQDPEHVRGAAPACANFAGAGIEGAKPAGADGGPRVHLFTGEKDPHRDDVYGQKPGIEDQTDAAETGLRKLGYRHVERTMVKGAGHSAFPDLVWKFVDQVMGAK